jgi:hypothetical protein
MTVKAICRATSVQARGTAWIASLLKTIIPIEQTVKLAAAVVMFTTSAEEVALRVEGTLAIWNHERTLC